MSGCLLYSKSVLNSPIKTLSDEDIICDLRVKLLGGCVHMCIQSHKYSRFVESSLYQCEKGESEK